MTPHLAELAATSTRLNELLEQWQAELDHREAELAAAAEMRLEEPGMRLLLREAGDQATMAERLRVVRLIEESLAWFHEGPTHTVLSNLKKNVSQGDHTPERLP